MTDFSLQTEVACSETDRILIISDTHLNRKFDRKKYDFLAQIIEPADVVILNGDFWDSYETRLRDFLTSEWQGLFARLRGKRTYYIFGNHDQRQSDLAAYQIFSQWQGDMVTLRVGQPRYHVEHGHRLAPHIDMQLQFLPKRLLTFGNIVQHLLMPIMGPRYLQAFKVQNAKMQRWGQHHLPAGTWLVTGHSHLAVISPELHFANSGMIDDGIGWYLTLQAGRLELHQARYA